MSFVKSKRKYYKYEDWIQPLLTSNTSSDLMTVSATNEGHQPAWKAFDGDDVSTAWNTYDGTTTGSITANFSDRLAISKIEVVPRYANGSWRTTSAEINGETKTFSSTETVTFNYDTPYVTNSLKITTKGNGWTGLNEVKITAKKIVESTIDDYDFYEYESLKNYILAHTKRIYYKYGTEPNVTIVGSPTISNGVVSGFSTANYLKTIPQNITDKTPTASNWEMVFKIKHVAGSLQFLYSQPTSYQSYFGVDSGNKMSFELHNSNSSSTIAKGLGSTVLTNGGEYWLKYEFTGSAYVMSLSTDGVSYTTEYTQSSTTKLADRGVNWLVGVSTQSGYTNPFKGSIDLSQSYIKVNGSIWWRGTKVNESTIDDYDFYEDRLVAYHPIIRGNRTYYKQTLNKQDTGTYTFTLDKEYNAKLLFVGNGGGGGSCQHDSKWFQASGGSGSCFEGRVKLPAGTYTVTLGTLGYGANVNGSGNMASGVDSTDSYLTDSNGNELIKVGCGARGKAKGVGGVGGTVTLGTLEVLETYKSKTGNTGNYLNPGSPGEGTGYALSAYDNTKTGYGAGTGSWRYAGNVYGIAGIFNLALETDANDYDYYEDIGTKIY